MSKITLILILALFALYSPKIVGQAKLEIEICNIHSNQGHILLSIFDSPEQFPRHAKSKFRDIKVSKENIKNDSVVFRINTLKPGKYAMALLDDENDSGDMDYNKLGLPLEGFGFSNNIKPIFKAPPYKKCQFEIREGMNKISIKVRYR